MRKVLELVVLSVIVVFSSSCNIDEELTTMLPPKIVLDSETGIYTVKQGREIVIAPVYEQAEGATYCWTMNDRVIATTPSLSFKSDTLGEYFITVAIRTEGGSDEEEIKVDVVDLEVPTVTIAGEKNLTVVVGAELNFTASVRQTSLPTTFSWSLNSVEVGYELSYKFVAEQVGTYTIEAKAANDDGSHSDVVTIEVLNAEDMPFQWEFERTNYHTIEGRKLLIKPLQATDVEEVEYSWTVVEQQDATGDDAQYIFVANEAGQYHITATASIPQGESCMMLSREFVVTVYKEKAFYRAKSGASIADWNKVYEYTPAPGQFINELKTGGFDASHTTAEAACNYVENRLKNANWVSLGGFGGYVVVGFDHSIDNTGDYDFAVVGNAFDGSSEPGVVWVMQDENGNGLPDDTWYELAGSETGKSTTIRDYAVTYYRPNGAGMPVQWTDNIGNSGEIDYLAQFHTQDYYYPLWIESNSYTLTGTRLEARNYDKSGNGSYWVNPHYDWGYTDNFSPIDFVTAGKSNQFKIANAIDFEGTTVHLSHIDFVKVQCAVNTKSGWLGELSTEVCGFFDSSMKKIE